MKDKKLINLLSDPDSPVVQFYKTVQYNDEPRLHQYNAFFNETTEGSKTLNAEWGGGTSFSKFRAINKAIGEVFERHSLGKYTRSSFVYSKMKDLSLSCLHPLRCVAFSEQQLKRKKMEDFIINEDSSFWWAVGKILGSDKSVFLPAQLVYTPYTFQEEPIIRLPISTGAALGESLKDALYKGICEVVERDAYIVHYLKRITPPEINLNRISKKLKNISEYFGRYRLDLRVFDITSDIRIPVYMAIVIDQTMIGPHFSIGLKCSLDQKRAILGAIEEAQHVRPWIRDEMSKATSTTEKIEGVTQRGMFWSRQPSSKLYFWLRERTEMISLISDAKEFSGSEQLQIITNILKNHGHEIYYKDVSTRLTKKYGFTVAKVIIPGLQPLFLDEAYKYYGGKRLNSLHGKINEFPHPFL